MLQWININKDGKEAGADATDAFVKASQGMGLSVFADGNFPELICICSGQDALAMAEKANRGVVLNLQSQPFKLAVAI